MRERILILPLLAAIAVTAGIEPKVTYRFDPEKFRDSSQLVVHVALPEGWHIQSQAPLDSFLIPTVLKAESKGLLFGSPVYPSPVEENFPALGGKVALFQGEFDVRIAAKRLESVARRDKLMAPDSVKVILRYQACNHTQCLPPREVTAIAAPPNRIPSLQ